MAFDAEGLIQFNSGGAIAGAGGTLTAVKKIWHYATNDADTVVEANGYFDNTEMGLGDLILASLDIDGTPEVKFYIVSVGTGDRFSNDVTIVPMDIGA